MAEERLSILERAALQPMLEDFLKLHEIGLTVKLGGEFPAGGDRRLDDGVAKDLLRRFGAQTRLHFIVDRLDHRRLDAALLENAKAFLGHRPLPICPVAGWPSTSTARRANPSGRPPPGGKTHPGWC